MAPIGVLCVDPDGESREETVNGLRSETDGPVTFTEADSVDAAKAALTEDGVDCVVSEYELLDGTGIDLFAHVREVAPDTGCILYTGVDYGAIDTGQFEGLLTEYVDRTGPRAAGRLASLVRTTATARAQASYPVPENDRDRVAALEEYGLDAEALAAPFERITTLAAAHFEVPRSSINVITDDTQRFLACYGADWDSTTREDSVCTFTIVDGGVMTVEDVREDPRFDGDALEGLGIRSYMGATLTTPDGDAIGTLCVYGEEPRSFSEADERYLQLLADVTVDLIELHDNSRPHPEVDPT